MYLIMTMMPDTNIGSRGPAGSANRAQAQGRGALGAGGAGGLQGGMPGGVPAAGFVVLGAVGARRISLAQPPPQYYLG